MAALWLYLSFFFENPQMYQDLLKAATSDEARTIQTVMITHGRLVQLLHSDPRLITEYEKVPYLSDLVPRDWLDASMHQ